jgi:hypothetical protein
MYLESKKINPTINGKDFNELSNFVFLSMISWR